MEDPVAKAVKARLANYKRGITKTDGRRARMASTVAVRKQKRLEAVQKKRRQATAAGGEPGTVSTSKTAEDITSLRPEEVRLDLLEEYVQALDNDDVRMVYAGVYCVRKLLAREDAPPTNKVVSMGAVPKLVRLLSHSHPDILFEAAWAITNVASTEHTELVCSEGAVPPLVDLLVHENGSVREQAIWCLGNVAGDGASLRDRLLATPGAVENLVRNIEHPESESLLRNAMWALANLCRGKPMPPMELVEGVVPVLVAALVESDDVKLLPDVLWGLSYLTDGDETRINAVLSFPKMAERLVGMVEHAESSIQVPALRTVGNIVTGTDEQTETMVRAGALPALAKMIACGRRNTRREACWAASNIAAGTKNQISALVATPGMLSALLGQMKDGEWNVRKEAAWTICNAVTQGRAPDVQAIVSAGALESIALLLSTDDTRILNIMLEALEAILEMARANDDRGVFPGVQAYTRTLEEHGGLEHLESLQDHRDERIFKRALHIIETYINTDDDDDVPTSTSTAVVLPSTGENQAPPTSFASSSRFGGFASFGSNNAKAPGPAPAQPPRFGASSSFASTSRFGAFGSRFN